MRVSLNLALNTSSDSSSLPTTSFARFFTSISIIDGSRDSSFPLGFLYDHIAAVTARNGSPNQKQVFLIHNPDYQELPDRNPGITHMPRGPHSRKDPAGKRGRPDRSGGAMEHGAVCCRASAEMMTLDQARESPPFAGSDHIDFVPHLENLVEEYLVPWFYSFAAVFKAKLPENTDRWDPGLLEASSQRLDDAIGPN